MYSGKDRVRAAIKRERADRYAVTAMIASYAAILAGISLKEFEENQEKYYQAHIQAYERFRPDVFMLYTSTFAEVEALGAEIERSSDRPSNLKTRILESKGRLSGLKPINPDQDGLFPVYLEAGQRLAKIIKGAPVTLSMMSPWSTAVNLRGAENLIMDTFDDPEFVHELMKFTTEQAKTVAMSISSRGLSVGMSDAGASLNLISPTIYREFVWRYNKQVIQYLKNKKVSLGMHACGYNDPILEDIISLEPVTLSIDSDTSLEKALELNNSRVVMIGNVDTKLFAHGTLQHIETAVKKCLQLARNAEENAFILCTACYLPVTSKLENLEHYFKVAKDFSVHSAK